VVTRTSTIWLEDGMLRVLVQAGITESLETARVNLDVLKKLAGDVKRPMLVDIRGAKGIERRARQLYGSRATEVVLAATAMLVKSGISRAVGNFLLGVMRPGFPCRLFTSEPAALAWLETYLQLQEDEGP